MEIEANKIMQEVENDIKEAVQLVDETKKLSVRFRDFMLRVFVRLSKLISCNKISLKSSCCDTVDNHVSTTTNNNNTVIHSPEVSALHTPESLFKRLEKRFEDDPEFRVMFMKRFEEIKNINI